MKIVYLIGNMSHYDYGLETVLTRTRSVFSELEVETETIDLSVVHPPFFEGETARAIDGVIDRVKNADGIIFACTAQLFAPTALMQCFLEYLELPEYGQGIVNKYCLSIVLSKNGGEKSALDYLFRATQHMGAFPVAGIGLQTHHLADLGGDTGAFVDKTTEDFYRAVHQNRRYVIPMDYPAFVGEPLTHITGQHAKTEHIPHPSDYIEEPRSHASSAAFSEQEEKDIEELSRLFSQKYTEVDEFDEPAAIVDITPRGTPIPVATPIPIHAPLAQTPPPPAPSRAKSTKQMTQSLPHYFQPQLSSGLQAVIQINITGAETFDGFIYIHSTECTYTEGTAPAPDIIVMADAAVWTDVLKGKHTAQKAFMIGGLKVRGDFVLLSKFDTLFKLGNV